MRLDAVEIKANVAGDDVAAAVEALDLDGPPHGLLDVLSDDQQEYLDSCSSHRVNVAELQDLLAQRGVALDSSPDSKTRRVLTLLAQSR